ncbi:hypothetical protein BpHYR1_033524 [Brachionus plicatilis]|uniref:Uncharacterized protein n=1 Tax=Brachionus plicatilis TaxID=10195 RepID=A0A3M7SFY1_BRAPC|nr:hypothetical protein BpHYR1_033524 [Brachionus plicatilis]
MNNIKLITTVFRSIYSGDLTIILKVFYYKLHYHISPKTFFIKIRLQINMKKIKKVNFKLSCV